MKGFWKIVKGIIAAAVLIFFISLASVIFVANYRRPIQKADAIIILGAAIYTPALYNRSLEGLRLYNDRKANLLVLSGGRISDKDISEAEYMKQSIISQSSTTPNMILEQNSHSTFDNIKNSKTLIPDAHSVIIVSDSYHLARGAATAKALGFSPVYWSSPDSSYYPRNELIFHYFREAIAMIAYIPKFIFNK